MLSFDIIKPEEAKDLAALADEIWHEYFPCILSQGQIDYMLKRFQSEKAVLEQLGDGYIYCFIRSGGDVCGYMCIRPEEKRLFLSKLYIKAEYRGRGMASWAMCFIRGFCKGKELSEIYLHVNKYNEHSIAVYSHLGFGIADSCVDDIGSGYVMDDYIMTMRP